MNIKLQLFYKIKDINFIKKRLFAHFLKKY